MNPMARWGPSAPRDIAFRRELSAGREVSREPFPTSCFLPGAGDRRSGPAGGGSTTWPQGRGYSGADVARILEGTSSWANPLCVSEEPPQVRQYLSALQPAFFANAACEQCGLRRKPLGEP